MKNLLTLLILVLASASYSQSSSINYKAIVKDNIGNIVANQSITVQFSILKGVAQTNVYQETHTPTTNANGLIIVNIGEGTIGSGDFSTIGWSSDDHFLNVQINTGSGLTDLGTTQFMAVPYALSARNVSGLEAIDEGNGIGWRLKGRDPASYGNLGDKAVDLSYYDYNSITKGATGAYSIAMGFGTTASGSSSIAMGRITSASGLRSTAMGYSTKAIGDYSTAMGYNSEASGNYTTAMGYSTTATAPFSTAMGLSTEASGDYSTAMGGFTRAIGDYSTAMGHYSQASGNYTTAMGYYSDATGTYATAMGRSTKANGSNSTAMGYNSEATGTYSTAMGIDTKAEGYSSTALGRYNLGGGNATNWIATDPLFEVGNGLDDANRNNALTILKNGTITAPSFDMAEITDAKALVTKEYADANLSGSGLEAIDEGNGIGWRLKGQDLANYGNIGLNAVDLSWSTSPTSFEGATGETAVAMGYNTEASGVRSFAMGSSCLAEGNFSVSLGTNCDATGGQSIAMGTQAVASETWAMSFGVSTTSSGFASVAMGSQTIASASYATALGRESVASGGSSTALGSATTATNVGSISMGSATLASGRSATSMGRFTRAQSYSGVALGRYNLGSGDSENWIATDPLFEIGNGVDDANRSNALTVLKNGYVGFNGNPDTDFHLVHGNNGIASGMKLQNTSNNSWWRFYVSSSSNDLRLYSTSQGTTIIGAFDDVSGAYTSSSDRRLKKNFKDLHFNWKDFMKLETLTYQYKVQKDKKEHIGLVAQDVESIYPELVNYNSDEDVYHLNYSGFGVVAIKAIQEQQKIIEDQASRIQELEANLSENKKRMDKIEALLSIK